MAQDVVLNNGTPAMVWPLVPDDRAWLREGYTRLSPESRYQRFLTSFTELSEGLLRVLVDSVDGVDHVALVLVALPPGGEEEVVGVARIIRYPDRPASADVAVTVADAWQGRGVATALLAALLRCRPLGVARLVTQVAVGNPASLAMLDRLGDLRIVGTVSGVHDVVVDLPERRGRVPAPRREHQSALHSA